QPRGRPGARQRAGALPMTRLGAWDKQGGTAVAEQRALELRGRSPERFAMKLDEPVPALAQPIECSACPSTRWWSASAGKNGRDSKLRLPFAAAINPVRDGPFLLLNSAAIQ